MVFVVHGAIFIGGDSLGNGETWHGEGEVVVKAGDFGATIWRWDLAASTPASFASNNLRSLVKLSAPLLTLPEGALLMRGDSVTFPPGGCALTHVHQGPGIRCLIEGGIRIDTHGRSTLRSWRRVVRRADRMRCLRKPRRIVRAGLSG